MERENELLVGGGVASSPKTCHDLKKRGVVYFDYFRRGVDISIEKLAAR